MPRIQKNVPRIRILTYGTLALTDGYPSDLNKYLRYSTADLTHTGTAKDTNQCFGSGSGWIRIQIASLDLDSAIEIELF